MKRKISLTDFTNAPISHINLDHEIASVFKNMGAIIRTIEYIDDGAQVELENGDKLEVAIDWNNIILV